MIGQVELQTSEAILRVSMIEPDGGPSTQTSVRHPGRHQSDRPLLRGLRPLTLLTHKRKSRRVGQQNYHGQIPDSHL